MKSEKLTRRSLLGASLLGVSAIPVIVETALAQAAPTLLNPTDPAAKALGYVEDTTKVDAKANPMHKAEQHCGNCLQWVDKNRAAPVSKCNLFPGKLVKNPGWCKVWVKAPGT
ncbi:MAG: high-potential iron-sulfur protein [Steroidobacteraceae bacterium]|jgi:hypothetical protein